MKLWNYSMAES